MTIYQVIAEEPRTLTRRLYTRRGTFMQEHSVTLPALRIVGSWPSRWLADRCAERKAKRFRQRYSVRIKTEGGGA